MPRIATLTTITTLTVIGDALTATGATPCYIAACCQAAGQHGQSFTEWAAPIVARQQGA